MNIFILGLLSSLLFLTSCVSKEESSPHETMDTKEVVIETLDVEKTLIGQWKTEGNGGVIPKWLEFDAANNAFYSWLDEEAKPSTIAGNYLIVADSLIEFNYTEYNEKIFLLIDSISENYLKVTPLGISAGSLVYTKTVYEENSSIEQLMDTITVEGTLLSIGESDFWGRIYLTLEVAGEQKSFTYLTYSIDRNKEVEKLINKKVSLKYHSEVTIEEVDLHFNGVGIHEEYSRVQKEEDIRNYGSNIIEGVITVTNDDISGDLPSSYWVTKSDGSKIEVVAFVYDEYVAHNGEKATVYFRERHKDLVVSITALEDEKPTAPNLNVGQD